MQKEIRLTIAIPTYNRCDLLHRTLESVMTQWSDCIEVIVSDNASTDGTEAMMEEYSQEKKVRYFRNPENLGMDKNFLKCLQLARGEYIHLLSDDDILLPGAVAKILSLIESERPDYINLNSFTYSTDLYNPNEKKNPRINVKEDIVTNDKKTYMELIGVYITYISATIIRKSDFLKIQKPERYFGTYFLHAHLVLEILKLKAGRAKNGEWINMVKSFNKNYLEKTIAIVGKYTMVPDAYISVTEAIKHAGIQNKIKAKIKLVDSEEIEKYGAKKMLDGVAGIVVPGGFGNRGIEGKIEAARYARENKVPYLGLCLGMQIAVIEFARNVAKLKNASSTEINEKTPYPVIDVMEDQKNITSKGGTMRLGAYECRIKKGTKAFDAYGKEEIQERHRHRYEFNNKFKQTLEKAGLVVAGINPKRNLVEIIEVKNHPFYVGVQFHPELKSRPNRPHLLFVEFMKNV